ncbi:hypothetical protein H2198_000317 [Neophaeococcomyces mojaviensis]|uniref:Uncharacterized protein n=1 Tax=Neophaeococcomyces mojaviensis TaxID=3383035 RepID=A0ACC3AK88_9EURO|nr:hypothetical protein H2198_000317 [Knufia sp. JES_112]
MQVAAFLSDLKSLSVCPHEAAMKLVSVHEEKLGKTQVGQDESRIDTTNINKGDDEDLRRANDLVYLHQNVKMKNIEHGFDKELIQAREDIQKVLASLNEDQ